MPIWSPCPTNKDNSKNASQSTSSLKLLRNFCPSSQPARKQDPIDEVVFTINKVVFKVKKDVPVDTSLNTYLRKYAHLPGTKNMCQEGGCGACVVSVRIPSPEGQEFTIHSVNSCLVPVYGCHGWDVMTVEGIKEQKGGYHPLETLLAAHNGSQCGYCSPGFVMNMYSLVENKPKLTKKDVEEAFDGNICRCTGYRPILEAFKSIASDRSDDPQQQFPDLEDLLASNGVDSCKMASCKSSTECKGNCLYRSKFEARVEDNRMSQAVVIESPSGNWFRPTSKADVFTILKKIGNDSYRFVAGNTANGVYRDERSYQNWIDLGGVPELAGHVLGAEGLTVGINITLSQLINVLHKTAEGLPAQYHYMSAVAKHIALVANTPVRNRGTLAGNLCIKRKHQDFPSDLFLLLETVGAKISYEKSENKSQKVSAMDFLKLDLDKVLLTHVTFPQISQDNHVVRTFKIMPRTKSVHAYVNAGFCFKVDKGAKFKVLERPRIVYGNISSTFVHATKTEELLEQLGKEGKGLQDKDVLNAALSSLRDEIKPSAHSPGASIEYRAGLAITLYYKFVLGLSEEGVQPVYRSGATLLERPVSSSIREYDTDRTNWPVNKPVPKVEAIYQCSGEAQYVDDIPSLPNELHSALVLTTVAKGRIISIDPSAALATPGVVAFYSAKDIPGINSFTSIFPDNEPVFCDEKVLYHGQAVGVLLAESQNIAAKSVSKVKVVYEEVGVPIIDMKQVIDDNITSRLIQQAEITPTAVQNEANETEKVAVKGVVDLHDQYHLTMELQTCLSVPIEDGMDVYSSTQWMENVHNNISKVLDVPAHKINMKVRRIGGGYGAKLTRATWVAAISAMAAKLSNRPVRIVLDLRTNMKMMGKRYPCLTTYEAEVEKATGKIVKLDGKLVEDAGWSVNDPVVEGTLDMLPSCYDSSSWNIKGSLAKTDKASNTWCRAPGSVEAIGTIEVILENIAETLELDPVAVRLANMKKVETNPLPSMIQDWRKHTDYDARLKEIKAFNNVNWWKKRGLSLVPLTYKLYLASRYNATVAIYAVDGTVAISHGGIECGQGINTKATQVCAYGLGIDMSLIQVKPTDIFISPNNEGTGGSVSSESICFAVNECCKKLQERLAPIRKMLPAGYTWKDLIQKAYTEQVKLNASHLFTSKDNVKNYDIYGVTVAEVEVDLLTGQHLVKRVDVLEDAGVSLSPEIDVGQVEGAFVMGLGYFTLEKLEYSPQGALLTDRTWNYYPPGSQDIPVDFRIQLRKNAPNPFGVLRSKATGEPPQCMAVAIPLAISMAIRYSQIVNQPRIASVFKAPITPETVFLACNNDTISYPI